MKLAATVILYHPPDGLLKNIATYYREVERLYVFDNTEETFCKSWFAGMDKVIFRHDGANQGIARRLNEACELATQEGYDWLLTMDQDSRFPPGTFATYLHCIQQQQSPKPVAAYGMKYQNHEVLSSQECQGKHTPFIITSGMLVNLKIATAIGGFDEQLFIDAVDHEYCIRANWKGYATIRFSNVLLHHAVGVPIKRASLKTLYLFKKAKAVHSPLRCYYMYRNALYLNQKYKKEVSEDIAHFNKIVKGNLNRNFWYGRSIGQFLRYLLKARHDYKKGKMGKIDSE